MSTETGAGRKLHAIDPEILQCPDPYYAELFATGAAAYDEGPVGWVVPGYEDLSTIGTDPARFSSAFFGEAGPTMTGISPEPFNDEVQALLAEMPPLANALFNADPPTHTRQKALVLKALNANRVRAMEPLIHQIADELIDGFIDEGKCELLRDFAIWLPMTTVCTVLGVDRADMRQFKVWTDHIAMGLVGPMGNTERVEVLRSVIDFEHYMLERIAARRQQPQDDLLTGLVQAELDSNDAALAGISERVPRKLTDAEIVTVVLQVLSAGNHTTTNLVSNALVQLIKHPQAMAEVRADHALIPNFLEEALRLEAPVRCTYRVTTKGVEVRGTEVPPGSMVSVAWGAAGHDPKVFPDPDTFDIHRANAKRHLSFGHGPHFCVGNQLARTQARIGFEHLLDRAAGHHDRRRAAAARTDLPVHGLQGGAPGVRQGGVGMSLDVPADGLLHTESRPGRFWSTANVGEALPGVVTPLGWSVWGPSIELAMKQAFWSTGALPASKVVVPADTDERAVTVFWGRGALERQLPLRDGRPAAGDERLRDRQPAARRGAAGDPAQAPLRPAARGAAEHAATTSR